MKVTVGVFILCGMVICYACHDEGPVPLNTDPDPIDTMDVDTMDVDTMDLDTMIHDSTTVLDHLIGEYVGYCFTLDVTYNYQLAQYIYTRDTIDQALFKISSIEKSGDSSFLFTVAPIFPGWFFIPEEDQTLDTLRGHSTQGLYSSSFELVQPTKEIYTSQTTRESNGPGYYKASCYYIKVE